MRSGADDLLIPLLPLDDARLDAETLATWHLALSSTLGVDLPHDLLAVWLYTADGPVLLGPTALAADGLTPPPAEPHVRSEAAEQFGRIFERAAYTETLVQPVAYGRSDVALLVCAAFSPSRDREAKRVLLLEVAQRLAPTLARAARQWRETEIGRHAPDGTDLAVTLLGTLAGAPITDHAPAPVLRTLLALLEPSLPHDAAAILVPGTHEDDWYRISDHRSGALWQDSACRLPQAMLEALGLVVGAATTPLPLDAPDAWRRLLPQLSGTPASVLVAPLIFGGRTTGLLLLASAEPEAYGGRERRLAAQVAPYLAARVETLLAEHEAALARARASALQAVPVQLGRLAALLATRPDAPAAWRELVAESTALLPLRRLRLAVRLGAADRVAFVTPGETRAFADLPAAPIAGTPLAELLAGERPWVKMPDGDLLEHGYPLRMGGEIIGAMLVATAADEPLGRAHAALAQQLADLLAPHVELQRRPYVRPPFAPGWKRISPG